MIYLHRIILFPVRTENSISRQEGDLHRSKEEFCLRHRTAPEQGPTPRAFSERIWEPYHFAKEFDFTEHHNKLDSSSAKEWMAPTKQGTKILPLPIHENNKASTLCKASSLKAGLTDIGLKQRSLISRNDSWQRSGETQPTSLWINQCSALSHYCISGWLLLKNKNSQMYWLHLHQTVSLEDSFMILLFSKLHKTIFH